MGGGGGAFMVVVFIVCGSLSAWLSSAILEPLNKWNNQEILLALCNDYVCDVPRMNYTRTNLDR